MDDDDDEDDGDGDDDDGLDYLFSDSNHSFSIFESCENFHLERHLYTYIHF